MCTRNSSYYDELIVCCLVFINFSFNLVSHLKQISILANMDGEELEELTDEQLTELDRMVENLSQNNHSSPIRNESARNGIALKRGRTSSFDGLTDDQLAAIDVEVENVSKRFSPSKTPPIEVLEAELNGDLTGFDELTATQFNLFDHAVEQFTSRQQNDPQQAQHHSHMNGNEQTTHTNAITASQVELAAALFDDEDDGNGPSIDHLECLVSRFKHNRFRDKQWEIIRAVMIEKRDVCAVMATGYGKSLCFQVFCLIIIQFFFNFIELKNSF